MRSYGEVSNCWWLNSNLETGKTIIKATEAGKATLTVKFKKEFSQIPKVVVTYAEAKAYNYGQELCVYDVTTSDFAVETFINPVGASLVINWIAAI